MITPAIRFKEELTTQFIHPLLSIASPFCMLVAINLTIRDLPGISTLFTFWHYLALLLMGICKVILNIIFLKERISPMNILREFILMTAGFYLLFSLFLPGPFLAHFRPSPANIYPTVMVLLQWGLTFQMHKLFHNRELLARVIRDKSGEPLLKELRHAAGLSTAVFRDMLLINRQLIIQGCVLFLVSGVMALTGARLQPRTLLWISFFMLATFLTAAAVNQFKQEYIDLREGINTPPKAQRRRFYFTLLFVGICILLALNFARTNALLKIPELPRQTFTEQLPDLPTIPPLEAPLMRSPFGDLLVPEHPWPLWLKEILAAIMKLIKIILLLGFIVLVLLPFFSRDFLRWLKTRKIFRFLHSRLKALGAYLKLLLQDIREFLSSLFVSRKLKQAARQAARETREQRNSAAREVLKKKRQTHKIIRLFVQLIHWGRRQGCRYFFSQTALDYIGQLCTRFPSLKIPLQQSVRLFEKSLFSPYLLEPAELQSYQEHVYKVIKNKG